MSRGRKKVEIGEKTVKVGNDTFFRIDKVLPKIVKDFSKKPEKEFGKIPISTFNGNKVFLWNIYNKASMAMEDVSFYIEVPYDTVYSAYYRHRDKLKEDKDYFYVERAKFEGLRPTLQNAKKGRKLLFVTLHGLLILLRYIKAGLSDEFYEMWVDIVCKLIETKQLSSTGQLFLINKNQELIPQIIGDKNKCFVDEEGFMYASKGEMLIAKTLRELGIHFQYNAPIHLPEKLINLLVKKYPKVILLEAGWKTIPPYITTDFLLRTEPRTVIEYWGMEDSDKYNAKREIKDAIYKFLDIKVISIEPHEDQNIPVLKQKLIKELHLEA